MSILASALKQPEEIFEFVADWRGVLVYARSMRLILAEFLFVAEVVFAMVGRQFRQGSSRHTKGSLEEKRAK